MGAVAESKKSSLDSQLVREILVKISESIVGSQHILTFELDYKL